MTSARFAELKAFLKLRAGVEIGGRDQRDAQIEDPELESSVERLGAWFQALDRELKATLESLSEDDIQSRVIDRGGAFVIPPMFQLHIYREALLIFYGKASIYLKALGKTQPEQWSSWIA